jgi:Dyp-type peroxidase family
MEEQRFSYSSKNEDRRQQGITFPSASQQENILVIRLDLDAVTVRKPEEIRQGLKKLCGLLDLISRGALMIDILNEDKTMESVDLSHFNFSATIGFGSGFFKKLGLANVKRPKNLYEMPDNVILHDQLPYILPQTDMIIQLCSTQEYVNKWVLHNDDYVIGTKRTIGNNSSDFGQYTQGIKESSEVHDIIASLNGWAAILDIHSGFQRHDGRNLMGFLDGISQPSGKLRDEIVWTTADDEVPHLVDGTYMVFQKIEHDLESWRKMNVTDQENWVGRSKATGLLLGTLSNEEDRRLAQLSRSSDVFERKVAQERLKKLLESQRNPETKFFSNEDNLSMRIQKNCSPYSHVRMANPRGAHGFPQKIIYRRGYLFMEDTILNPGRLRSGLLFICFQRNVKNGFEYIKKNFFNTNIISKEKSSTPATKYGGPENSSLDRQAYGRNNFNCNDSVTHNKKHETLPFNPVTLGGGYYFIPPVQNNKISEIGQWFFS